MAVKIPLMQKLPVFNNLPEAQRYQCHFVKKSIKQSKSSFGNNHSHCRSHQLHKNADSGDYMLQEEKSENRCRKVERLIGEFDPLIPVEEAFTPPSSWYTDTDFYGFELNQVFYTGWQAVDWGVLNTLCLVMTMARCMLFTMCVAIMHLYLLQEQGKSLALSVLIMVGLTGWMEHL